MTDETCDTDRYARGLTKMQELGSIDGVAEFLAGLADIAPDLGTYVAEFVYGDIYSRTGLTLPQQQLVTLSTLAALGGCERELTLHVGIALGLGISPASIVDVFIHQSAYAGFPRALNAIGVAGLVFAERGITPPHHQVP